MHSINRNVFNKVTLFRHISTRFFFFFFAKLTEPHILIKDFMGIQAFSNLNSSSNEYTNLEHLFFLTQTTEK